MVQSWGWWFETLSCPLWRHCNEGVRWSYLSHSRRVTYPRRNTGGQWSLDLRRCSDMSLSSSAVPLCWLPPGVISFDMDWLKYQHEHVITSSIMYENEILFYSQTSTAQPLKFLNGKVVPSHTLLGMRLLNQLGLKAIHASKRGQLGVSWDLDDDRSTMVMAWAARFLFFKPTLNTRKQSYYYGTAKWMVELHWTREH